MVDWEKQARMKPINGGTKRISESSSKWSREENQNISRYTVTDKKSQQTPVVEEIWWENRDHIAMLRWIGSQITKKTITGRISEVITNLGSITQGITYNIETMKFFPNKNTKCHIII